MSILTHLPTAPIVEPPREWTDGAGPEGHAGRKTISIGVLEVYIPQGFAVSVDSASYTGPDLTQLTLSFTRRTQEHHA